MFTDADHSMGLRGAYWELMAWLESFVSLTLFFARYLLLRALSKIAISKCRKLTRTLRALVHSFSRSLEKAEGPSRNGKSRLINLSTINKSSSVNHFCIR